MGHDCFGHASLQDWCLCLKFLRSAIKDGPKPFAAVAKIG